MTNTERIQANNAGLRECIETAEALPDAGSGVEAVIEALAVTANGTYTAPDGVDGYSPVTVNVPIPDGYIVPSGTLDVTENGTHDVTEYASVDVNLTTDDRYDEGYSDGYEASQDAIVLQEKTATENGEVTADEGYTGLSKVTVNVEASGSDSSELLKSIVTRTITEVDLPSDLTMIGDYAFYGCTNLEITELPNEIATFGSCAFMNCRKFNPNNMPRAITQTGTNCFNGCHALERADFHETVAFGNSTFQNCYALTALILRGTSGLCTAGNANIAVNSAIQRGTGYIYVPSALIEEYKAATNWSAYADQFRAIEDYPDICGG